MNICSQVSLILIFSGESGGRALDSMERLGQRQPSRRWRSRSFPQRNRYLRGWYGCLPSAQTKNAGCLLLWVEGHGRAQRRGPRLRYAHHPLVRAEGERTHELKAGEVKRARSVIVMAALLQWYSELKACVAAMKHFCMPGSL